MRPEVVETVNRHIAELRQLALDKEITTLDHDTVGCLMRDHIGHLVGVSDKAWDTFKRIIDESRAVHYALPNGTTNRGRLGR